MAAETEGGGGDGGEAGGGGGGGGDAGDAEHAKTPQHVHNGFSRQHRRFVPSVDPPAPSSTVHCVVSETVSLAPASHPAFDAAHPVHAQLVSRTPPVASTHPLYGADVKLHSVSMNSSLHLRHLFQGTSEMNAEAPFV